MMESSNLNLDLHHQEDHIHGTSSSSLVLQRWNQDLLLNSSGEFCNGALSSSRDHFMTASSTLEMPMVQDFGFQWGLSAGGSHGEGYNMMNMNHSSSSSSSSSSHYGLGLHLPKSNIRDELSMADSFAKLTGINLQDLNTLMPISAGFEPIYLGTSNGRQGSFSMVLPTANISGSSITQSLYPSSLGMDLQALNLLASAGLGRTMSQPSQDSMALFREDLACSFGQLQEPPQTQVSTTPHKASLSVSGVSVSGVTEAKRSYNLDSRTSQPAAKKPRFESRSSFTPFKVRKEKLGDRIAALQQLVAPFGKTDTASVLMEAIGYIKFLQDQVETLSVPYMRSSNNKKARTLQGGTNEERDEPKPDLRSRGLCLVPLSCTSYVTNEDGGVWSPPNYRGGSTNM